MRFPVLNYVGLTKLSTQINVILACGVLWNFLLDCNDTMDFTSLEFTSLESTGDTTTNIPTPQHPSEVAEVAAGCNKRHNLVMNYFQHLPMHFDYLE